jgi:acyl-CoA reductase-like NAD-dependent aldehyde dehydrogenase
MATMDACPGDKERNESEKVKVENGNVRHGEKVFGSKGLSVISPGTGKQIAVIPYVNRAFLNKAINDARNAF